MAWCLPFLHDWSKWERFSENQCLEMRRCQHCQKIQTRPVPHTFGKWETVDGKVSRHGFQADVTWKIRQCVVCGYFEKERW